VAISYVVKDTYRSGSDIVFIITYATKSRRWTADTTYLSGDTIYDDSGL